MTRPQAERLDRRTAAAIVELLGRERLMTLACRRADGWPHATTVGYLNQGLDLYFFVARSSHKFANLNADPRAAAAIRTTTTRGDPVGVSMTGRVDEVLDPAVVQRLNLLVAERYPQVHVYCPSANAVAVMHFRPVAISVNCLTHGRSEVQTFRLEADDLVAAGSAPP